MTLNNLIENVRNQIKLDIPWISLILVNLITFVLAIIQKWDIGTIFYIYLFQTIILWFFTILKLLFKKNINFIGAVDNTGKLIPVESEDVAKFQVIIQQISWILFYGFYFLVFWLLFKAPIFSLGTITVIILFFINHLISFIYYLKKDTNKEQLAQTLTKITGYRFVVIHTTIWLTGLFSHFISKTEFSFNLIALIILCILKTPVDIYFHNKEHQTIEDIYKEKKEIVNKIKKNEEIVKSIKERVISPEEKKRNIILTIFLFVFFILPLFFGIIGILIWFIYFLIYLKLIIKPITGVK